MYKQNVIMASQKLRGKNGTVSKYIGGNRPSKEDPVICSFAK